MNNKLCTHPDGCQNEEPRSCLNEGCKEMPDEIQTIVCEEILSGVIRYFPGITIEQKQMIFAAMKKYAERRLLMKDAQLKEAIELLRYWQSYEVDGILDAKIEEFFKKINPGREAGKDE